MELPVTQARRFPADRIVRSGLRSDAQRGGWGRRAGLTADRSCGKTWGAIWPSPSPDRLGARRLALDRKGNSGTARYLAGRRQHKSQYSGSGETSIL